MKNARIVGIAKALPEMVVSNKMLEEIVDTSDQWIREMTGIENRHIATKETTTSLAIEAGRKALDDAGMGPEEVDMILVATMTPDDFMPSTACKVQHALGAVNAAALDVSAACSGFIYAITVADQFIKTEQMKTILVVGAEVLTKTVDWEDRSTCVIFADGAGAVVLTASEKEGIVATELGAKGETGEILRTPALENKNYFIQGEEKESIMTMDGQTVFRFSTKIFGKSVKKVLEGSGYSLEDIDVFVPHQANIRIIDYAASRFKVDVDRFYVNLNKRGNTSAASIPIALADMKQEGLLKKGMLICCTGFGGGLTWGSALIRI
ncbi:ketoacyl-ACP synthase III [Clostridia bacterium]|nr:ketoacyl-ACP synthase III [Clostridia bacterium]